MATASNMESYFEPKLRGDWMGANVPFHTDPLREESVTFLHGLGVKMARPDFFLSGLLNTSTRAAMCDYAAFMSELGMNVVALVGYSPGSGYELTPGNGHSAPSDAGLTMLAGQLRKCFRDLMDAGVRILEMWNEWNNPSNFAGGDDIRLARVWRTMATQWKVVAREKNIHDAIVLSGGLAATAAPYAPTRFTDMLNVDKDVANYFDGVAHHPGAHPYNPWVPAEVNQDYNAVAKMPWQLRDILSVVGRPRARVWATEIPWPTWGTAALAGGEGEQVSRCTEDLGHWFDWQDAGWAGPVLVYHGMRDLAPGSDTTAGFGIRRADGTPKPVCNTLRDLALEPFPINTTA